MLEIALNYPQVKEYAASLGADGKDFISSIEILIQAYVKIHEEEVYNFHLTRAIQKFFELLLKHLISE